MMRPYASLTGMKNACRIHAGIPLTRGRMPPRRNHSIGIGLPLCGRSMDNR